jgi:hypothetical protein
VSNTAGLFLGALRRDAPFVVDSPALVACAAALAGCSALGDIDADKLRNAFIGFGYQGLHDCPIERDQG